MRTAAITMSRRALVSCVIALLMTLAALGGTQSAVAASGCPGTLATPFSAFGDLNQYWLATGGSFEGANSWWTFSGGAAIVAGNETFFVDGRTDARSLLIPPGGSATSPSFCVTTSSPLMRFFAKGGDGSSPLIVTEIAATTGGTGQVKKLASTAASAHVIGSVTGSLNWAPTAQIPLDPSIAQATGKGALYVQLSFSNPGTTAWQIDDVYVDPRKSN